MKLEAASEAGRFEVCLLQRRGVDVSGQACVGWGCDSVDLFFSAIEGVDAESQFTFGNLGRFCNVTQATKV